MRQFSGKHYSKKAVQGGFFVMNPNKSFKEIYMYFWSPL